ncbi:MAG: UDP-N-acetylmuramate--L-alanine ligase [Verrucomicrobiales bacterium]
MSATLSLEELATFLKTGRRRIHLLGVAGSGMSGLAALFLELGHEVAGADRATTKETERLERLGLEFHLEQRARWVRQADLVVYSSAIREAHPAMQEARRLGIPCFRRAEALAALLSLKSGIVIAGTHGKTTTSAMTAHLLRCADLKASHYVGAEIPILGTNASWDREGAFFVAEGDESDGTLALYHPEHLVVLNIEAEHLDFYSDLSAIEDVFRQVMGQTHGTIFVCADDPVGMRLAKDFKTYVSFGFDQQADYRVSDITTGAFCSEFSLWHQGVLLGRIELGVPGRHNCSNASAAIAVALECGASWDTVQKGLKEFRGARRRMEVKYQSERFLVVDDYGHHPTEIRATLNSLADAVTGQVRVLFQPHRFSRTKLLRDEFSNAFAEADQVAVTHIYPASEDPIPGIDAQFLAAAIQASGHPAVEACGELALGRYALARKLKTGDLFLTLGAGNVHEEGKALARDLLLWEKLADRLGEERVRLYEPMAKHTTLRVGGPAQFWIELDRETQLAVALSFAAEEGLPWMVVGRGSNLLVRDGGIPGLVLRLDGGEFEEVEVDGDFIRAGAGIRFKQLAALARTSGLAGFEWMEGIPGSVGGGLRMNAGAMGVETFSQIEVVRTMDLGGRVYDRRAEDLEVGYRQAAKLDSEIAMSAVFRGQPDREEQIRERMNEMSGKRKSSQPVSSSAGCIFRNPEAIPAGKLIEELGLKNQAIGDARISEVHANFIVNDGRASARDVLELIALVQEKAMRERQISLHPEVRIVGIDTAV